MAMAGTSLWKRQAFNNSNSNNDGYGYGYPGESWWWTPAGMAVRYAIVAFLFAFIIAFFVGGYYHAQRRVRNGQEPLAYHRWMVKRREAYHPPQPRYAWPHDPNAPAYGPSYGMEGYPPPPPAYNTADMPPPVYQPPPGATKAMADQDFAHANHAGASSSRSSVAEPAVTARQ